MTNSKSCRTFVIPQSASIADPAWMIAMWEPTPPDDKKRVGCLINPNGESNHVAYSNYDELKNLIHTCELSQAESAGYSRATSEICEAFGVHWPELMKLAKQHKAKLFAMDHLPEGSH